MDQGVGEYDLVINTVFGYPKMSQRTRQTSFFTGKNFTQRSIAKITNLSTRKSGNSGTLINVTGVGFSANVSDYTCTVAGEACKVTVASKTQLTI